VILEEGVIALADKTVSDRFKRKRSSILFLITTLIILVFIAFGMVTMLLFRSSQDRLIKKTAL
jgi:cell division septal protein FtsQ